MVRGDRTSLDSRVRAENASNACFGRDVASAPFRIPGGAQLLNVEVPGRRAEATCRDCGCLGHPLLRLTRTGLAKAFAKL